MLRNNAVSGLPIIDPNQPGTTTSQSHTGFGDVSFTPRVLLHETQTSHSRPNSRSRPRPAQSPLRGNTALTPNVSFWNNFSAVG